MKNDGIVVPWHHLGFVARFHILRIGEKVSANFYLLRVERVEEKAGGARVWIYRKRGREVGFTQFEREARATATGRVRPGSITFTATTSCASREDCLRLAEALDHVRDVGPRLLDDFVRREARS